MAPKSKARQQPGNMRSRQQAKLNSQKAQKAPIQPAPRTGPRRQLPPSTQGGTRVGNSSQPWGSQQASGQRVDPVRVREVGRPQLPPGQTVPESRRLPGMQGPQPAPRPQRPGTSRPAAPSRQAAAQSKLDAAAKGTRSNVIRTGTGSSSKPPTSTPKSAPTTAPGRQLPKGVRALAGAKARAAGAGLGIAGSVLSGDAKGAAITGGTFAAGKALQALPNPAAKLAGKALEFASPFAPGAVNALSSGSSKVKAPRASSGARSKADLIGGAKPKNPASFNEKAYASQQKFSVPKSAKDDTKSAAAASPKSPAVASAPNRSATSQRMSAPTRRPASPKPAESKQTGDKAKDMETWRKANPTLAKALDYRMAKKQADAALKISGSFDSSKEIYSPSTKVDGSGLDISKIDQKKVSEYLRRRDRYYS